jgi:hypothetical protein
MSAFEIPQLVCWKNPKKKERTREGPLSTVEMIMSKANVDNFFASCKAALRKLHINYVIFGGLMGEE